LYLSAGASLTVAIATVDGLVTAGLEGDFGGLAALRAGGGEHLTGGAVRRAAAGTGRFPGLAALRTALGLVSVAFGLEELLVRGAEYETFAAIRAS